MPSPALLRFWTTSTRDYNGRFPSDLRIRIEYLEDGELRTTCGNYIADSHAISWHYDQPPLAVDSDACDAARDCGESARVRGAEYQGCESYEQMCSIVETRAFVALMAAGSEAA